MDRNRMTDGVSVSGSLSLQREQSNGARRMQRGGRLIPHQVVCRLIATLVEQEHRTGSVSLEEAKQALVQAVLADRASKGAAFAQAKTPEVGHSRIDHAAGLPLPLSCHCH